MNRTHSLLTVFIYIAVSLAGCSFPQPQIVEVTATPTYTETPVGATATETPLPPFPTVELGRAENPLILALPPSADSPEQINAAKLIASQFTERTGYSVVTVAPDSSIALVDALAAGNAHIVLLDPYAYELAYRQDLVRAAYAVLKDGEGKYGAQFLATRRGGFTSYFDEGTQENLTEDRAVALAQFEGKKPCWSDESSPSGYVVPLGYLNESQISTKPAAFVEGHPTVVRSLYASGICDFGATYIDARKFPSLEDEFPDLLEQVIVVWQIPAVIPYDVLAFSTRMPAGMPELFASLVPAIMQTDAGRAAFKTAYDVDELEAVNDGYYEEFRIYVDESGVDLTTILK
ncbi:MAG TPA: PhnD/SsuA/transferrin family substrate-binding protein [Anaerolineales bacterium]|nr:PhnD/SsuA/transferrin family substrate-binding protein [Anaerolineales bacterium]